jgi:predicted outer membrane repeat protein
MNANISMEAMQVFQAEALNGHGGVARIESGSTLFITASSSVTKATAGKNGGVVSISDKESTLVVRSLNTTQCHAKIDGGVFQVENGASLEATQWTSTHATVGRNGGALSGAKGAQIRLSACDLSDSVAAKDGGHIHLTSQTTLSLVEGNMKKSHASGKGGSIYAEAASHIEHDGKCTLRDGTAIHEDGGGLLYLSSSNFIMQKTTNQIMKKTFLLDSTAKNGGAATVTGDVIMNHLIIKGHKSNHSGTIHVLGGGNSNGAAAAAAAGASDSSSAISPTFNTISTLKMSYIDMKNNHVNEYGGHIYVGEFGAINATKVAFHSGQAERGGGAVYGADRSHKVIFHDVQIISNQNTAVIFQGKTMSCHHTTFVQNSASEKGDYGGGAIIVTNQAHSLIVHTTFDQNVATNREGGDVVCSGGSTCVIQSSLFQGRRAKNTQSTPSALDDVLPSKGGALAVLSESSMTVLDTIFNHSCAKVGGGAIYVKELSNLTTTKVQILHGRANKGAGILLESAQSVKLTDTIFDSCESVYDGGALHATKSNVIAKKLQFVSNSAGIFGGAILISEAASLEMEDSTIAGNGAWLGGGLALDRDSTASVKNTKFTDNQARMGGGFYVSVNPSQVLFVGSTFSKNTARFGSAMFVEFSNVEIQRTTISDNIATLFAAVRVTGLGSFKATMSTFLRNTAQRGGALYLDDNTNTILVDTTMESNVAEEDGGAVYCSGAATVSVMGCSLLSNAALEGEGGAISRTKGCSLTVMASEQVERTKFVSNVAKTVGGAMSLNALICRSKESCSDGEEGGASTMTSDYEQCRSGEAFSAESATNTKFMEELQHCTNIKQVDFQSNRAAAGAGMYWYRQWHFSNRMNKEQYDQYLPCPNTNTNKNNRLPATCTFQDNLASSCKPCNMKTDLGCYSCESNIQTDTQNIILGWSPNVNVSIQSGTPIENSLYDTSPEDTDIYLVAVDYYNTLSRLDDSSNCKVERYCENTKEDSSIENCYDPKAGLCKIQDSSIDPLSSSKLYMTGVSATADKGIVRFYDLVIKADPNSDVPYKVRYICSTTSLDDDASGMTNTPPCNAPTAEEELKTEKDSTSRRLVTTTTTTATAVDIAAKTAARPLIYIDEYYFVHPCSPGSQLTSDQVCERCSAGKYSNDGMRCTACPTGGRCDQRVQISEKTWIPMGVATPLIRDGYWNATAPPEWIDNECNTTKNIFGTRSPRDIVSQWGTSEECQPGDCVDDLKWSIDRLHRCRRNVHFYKCDAEDACVYIMETNTSNATACSIGYEGAKCGVCSVGFHKTGNDLCIPCMGDDPVISKILYAGSLSLFLCLFLLLLYQHLTDKGIKCLSRCNCCVVRLVSCCSCCYGVWCLCSCCRKKNQLTKEEKSLKKEIRLRKNAGKRKRGLKQGEDIQSRMDNDTVWFRPEKYKILLSFLQVFQEFRSTYKIQWPPMVEEYMEMFSGLVDFDVFRLTAVDCIYTYTYLHQVWFVVIFPTGCLLLLILCHLLGKYVRTKQLLKYDRMINGKSTGFEAWPPILNKKSKSTAVVIVPKKKNKRKKSLKRTQSINQKIDRQKSQMRHKAEKAPCTSCNCFKHCWGRLLNLQHAVVDTYNNNDGTDSAVDIDAPKTIVEIQKNVANWKKRVHIQINMRFFLNKVIRIFFWILLLSFIPVTSILLRFFLCDPIAERSYLTADLRVECHSPEYNQMLPIAMFGCVFYIVGIPLCFFGVLSSARNENVKALTLMLTTDEHERARYLAMARADVETEGGIFTPPHTLQGQLIIIQQYARRKNLRSHKTNSRIGFIVQSYSEWAWWYEMWELFRKLMLVGVIALLRPGTVMQILWGLGICVGSSFVSLLIRPYKQLDDGWLNNLCLAQLQFVLFCGLLIRLDVDLFAREGKGDSTYDAQFAIGLAVIASHISVLIVALCLLSYEIANAPRHQAAVRASLQRKREAARRNLELWAKGRRMALMRKAKRDKENEGDGGGGGNKAMQKEVTDLETEQLCREAELRDEYDDLQKEIQSLGLINNNENNDDTSGASASESSSLSNGDDDTHQFLVDEKTRMERKKKQLELQMNSILEENNANVKQLELVMNARKAKAKNRLAQRLAKRKKGNGLRTRMNIERGKSKFKRLIGVGHHGEHMNQANQNRIIPINSNSNAQDNASMVRNLQDEQKRIELVHASLDKKNMTIFQLLGYFKKGDASIDQSIVQYIQEHGSYGSAADDSASDDSASNSSDKNGIDLPRDESGSTLLVAAVRVNNLDCVSLLLQHKADVTKVNTEHATCLHYAACAGNSDMVNIILKANVESGNANYSFDNDEFVHLQDSRGNTAASYAAMNGYTEIAKKLGLDTGGTMKPNQKITLRNNNNSNSSALNRWRRAAWRKGMSKVQDKKNVKTNFLHILSLAKAKKKMEEELQSIGKKPFDPTQSEEHIQTTTKLNEQIDYLTEQLKHATESMNGTEEKTQETTAELERLKSALEDISEKESVLRVDYEKEAKERRKLHNTIEDMKGSIRVFCRIRPLSSSEIAKSCTDITEYVSNKTSIRLVMDDLKGQAQDEEDIVKKTFSFDSVFSPVDSQEEIFQDVQNLVQSAVDGYNVCVFAYGQTGSGKTYTMNGTKTCPGLQPRSIQEIYTLVTRDSDKIDYKISCYMIEMYLDTLHDLLQHIEENSAMIGEKDRKGNLVVRKDTNGQVVVHGVTCVVAKTASELNSILDSGMRKRKIAKTKMNDESSRSHLISTILIEGTDRSTKLITTGKLTLVDLAGSESQKKTGASGLQLKEAKAINSSLSALGGVISSLTTKKEHVPYRNSKLTELLQDGLGGNAKCLMFVNASPADYNRTETCSSFDFALRCKKIQNSRSGATVESQEVKLLKEKLILLEAKVGEQKVTELK